MAEMSAAPAIGVPVAQVVGMRDVLITDESQPATRDGHTARDRRYCGGRLSRKSCILVSAVSVLLLLVVVIATTIGLIAANGNGNDDWHGGRGFDTKAELELVFALPACAAENCSCAPKYKTGPMRRPAYDFPPSDYDGLERYDVEGVNWFLADPTLPSCPTGEACYFREPVEPNHCKSITAPAGTYLKGDEDVEAGGSSYFLSVTTLPGEDVSETCDQFGCYGYDCDSEEDTTLDEVGTVCVAESGSGDSGILT